MKELIVYIKPIENNYYLKVKSYFPKTEEEQNDIINNWLYVHFRVVKTQSNESTISVYMNEF